MQSRFARWVRTSTPRSREIVREILHTSHPAPLTIQDIYRRVLKDYSQEKVPIPPPLPNPRLAAGSDHSRTKRQKTQEWKPPPDPPHPSHPIRSLTYLKKIVMEDMAHRNEVSKVHSMREPTPEELARKNDTKAQKKKKGGSGPPVVLNVKGMIDQWGWALKTADKLEMEKQDRLRVQKAAEGLKMLDTKKVEKEKQARFEAEWGHLNLRRQRARVGKLEREEELAKLLDQGREEGRAEVERVTI